MSEIPYLHVYCATEQHGSVKIMGTRAGLQRMAVAISAALKGERGHDHYVIAGDGEGYQVRVQIANAAAMEAAPQHYAQPGLPWEVKMEPR